MFKWLVITICIIAAVWFVSSRTGILNKFDGTSHVDTTSLKDTGKIIKGLKDMKQKREEDVKKSEEGL